MTRAVAQALALKAATTEGWKVKFRSALTAQTAERLAAMLQKTESSTGKSNAVPLVLIAPVCPSEDSDAIIIGCLLCTQAFLLLAVREWQTLDGPKDAEPPERVQFFGCWCWSGL